MRLCSHFFKREGHVTVSEISGEIKGYDPAAPISTVYRTTALLCEAKMLRQVQFGDGITRYEQIPLRNHYHLICERCGKILETEEGDLEPPQTPSSCCHGYKITYRQVNLFGICPDCLSVGRPM